MTKDLAKLFNECQNEFRQVFKVFRETSERNFRTDIRDIRKDIREVRASMNFLNNIFEDLKGKVDL